MGSLNGKKMGKDMPCNHQQKQDCKHGMCLTRLCCNVSGFVQVKVSFANTPCCNSKMNHCTKCSKGCAKARCADHCAKQCKAIGAFFYV